MFELLSRLVGDSENLSFLRLGSYITVRAGLALVAAFLFSIFAGPRFIESMRRRKAVQYIRRSEGAGAVSLDKMHAGKAGTPSMGGVLMFGAVVFSMFLFGNFSEPVFWLAMFAAVGFAAIGFADDYLKMTRKQNGGLTTRQKLVAQVIVGGVFATILVTAFPTMVNYEVLQSNQWITYERPDFIHLPFIKNAVFFLGWLFIPFAILVLTGTSNAVNLTDGLDGLAAGVTVSSTLCFAVIAYIAGRVDASDYLIIPYVQGAGELSVILAALTGACFGFLWFNSHPAQIFMGDTGSLMLGGLIGAVALLTKQEFLLLIVGGVFVAEALSVILQVGSYKMRGKRIFRMAPLHHHFEKCGIPESKIIARFWIVSALLSMAGLITLKFR